MAAPSKRWTNVALVVSAVGFLSFEVSIVSPRAQTTSGTAAPAATTAFGNLSVAKDPGLRGGDPGAGAAIDGLDGDQLEYFTRALDEFSEAEGVSDGLGPRMNLDSCRGCHLQPAVGGSSPAVNPQVAFATQDGGTDQVPSFITEERSGPRGAFREKPGRHRRMAASTRSSRSPDRGAATGCTLRSRTSRRELANHNVIFRIPTPTFGAGLIESNPGCGDPRERGEQRADEERARHPRPRELPGRRAARSRGQTNNNGNDGTIARFGWKAQNKSLLLFSGEAYNVEMGITNELFQTERDETDSCQFATVPNDVTNMAAADAVRRPERHREVRDLHAVPGAADAFVRHAWRRAVDRQRTQVCSARPAARCATRPASRPATRASRRCATRRSTCSRIC